MRQRTKNYSRASTVVLLTGLVILSGPAVRTSWSQVVKGAIEGTVVDSTGAVVPGAQVVVLDPATSSTGKSISDNTGAFRIPLLAVGTYNLTVNKEGFRKLSVVGVQVNSAATTNVGTLQLELGQATTTVEVSADAVHGRGHGIPDHRTLSPAPRISMLPVVGQNEGLDNLAVLLPGVNNTRDNNYSQLLTAWASARMEFEGGTTTSKSTGQNNNDNSVAGPSIFLGNTDWVQEYQVTTSNFGVEYSRNSGSVVNIVTKSGNQQLAWGCFCHGE